MLESVIIERFLAQGNNVSKLNFAVQEQTDRDFVGRIDHRSGGSADASDLKTERQRGKSFQICRLQTQIPALPTIQRRSRTYGPFVAEGERFFRKASYPLIFAAPNNVICALSAATGVRLRTFIALNLSGTVARLVVIRQLGYVFASPLQSIVDFIARYRTPVLIVSAVAVAWTIFGEFRGDNSQMKGLAKLASEDDEPDPTADQEPPDDDEDSDRATGGATESSSREVTGEVPKGEV